jgi:hypothetical protein
MSMQDDLNDYIRNRSVVNPRQLGKLRGLSAKCRTLVDGVNIKANSILDEHHMHISIINKIEFLIALLDDDRPCIKWAATHYINTLHQNSVRGIVHKLVDFVENESDDDLVSLSVSMLGREYWDTSDRVIGKLFAGLVIDDNRTLRVRKLAYVGIHYILGRLNTSTSYRDVDLDNMDWEIVRLFV